MVCVSHAFVSDAVDINSVSSIKLPSYAYVQVTAGRKLNFGRSADP